MGFNNSASKRVIMWCTVTSNILMVVIIIQRSKKKKMNLLPDDLNNNTLNFDSRGFGESHCHFAKTSTHLKLFKNVKMFFFLLTSCHQFCTQTPCCPSVPRRFSRNREKTPNLSPYNSYGRPATEKREKKKQDLVIVQI